MKTKYIKQIEKQDLLNINFDLIISSSGYEVRSTYLSSLLNNSNNNNKIVFSFSDLRGQNERNKNDNIFHKLRFNSIKCDGNNSEILIKNIDDYIISSNKDLSILIDYSSMTRVWYGSIINYFKNLVIQNRQIIIYFAYSLAEYNKPNLKDSKTSHFEPIDGFCNLSVPSIPTALITGLGYEKNKAFGLKEFFDAELLYLFYTIDNEFTFSVLDKNKELIDRTSREYILPYNINDVLLTKTILLDLCSNLKKNFRIIIAPCGPKPFTIISFLVAAELGSIDVWRISGETVENNFKAIPNGKIITFEICYY